METQVTDGQTHDQEPGESHSEGEHMGSASKDDQIDTLKAQIELLTDSFSELQSTIATRNTQPAANQYDQYDDDDDEPVTASKMRKTVQAAVTDAVSQTAKVNERKSWDRKAMDEFPISDPKFKRELNRTWKEMASDGYNVSHEKAMYRACRETALKLGTAGKKPASSRQVETQHTAEAPSSESVPRSSGSAKLAPIDHPNVQFYMMRIKDPKKIEAFRAKLGQELGRSR